VVEEVNGVGQVEPAVIGRVGGILANREAPTPEKVAQQKYRQPGRRKKDSRLFMVIVL